MNDSWLRISPWFTAGRNRLIDLVRVLALHDQGSKSMSDLVVLGSMLLNLGETVLHERENLAILHG